MSYLAVDTRTANVDDAAAADINQLQDNLDAILSGNAPTAGALVINEGGENTDFRVESNTNTHALFVEGSSSNIGIGTSTMFTNGKLSIVNSTGFSAVGSTNATDSLAKSSRFGGAHFTNSEEPVTGVITYSDGTDNTVAIGGGTSVGNAATILNFYTAATDTTLTGTLRMAISSIGNVGIGVTPAAGRKLDVYTSGTSDSVLGYFGNDTGTVYAGWANTAAEGIFGTVSNHAVGLYTNNIKRVIINTAGNVKIGGSAARGTTAGTAHLDIFNGTAPAGTLTNGISLYSSSGEAYVMDAAGNATLLSPHDQDNNWIYRSKDTTTGKVLKIDMEKMLKFLNDKFGTDFIHEYMEAV